MVFLTNRSVEIQPLSQSGLTKTEIVANRTKLATKSRLAGLHCALIRYNVGLIEGLLYRDKWEVSGIRTSMPNRQANLKSSLRCPRNGP